MYLHENISRATIITVQRQPVGVAEASFYIQILRRFSNSVNEDYKNQSHSKQITFPRYMDKILGIRISLRNPG